MTQQRLTDRFHDALVYAAEIHQTQTRKGSDIPYISHLLSVAALVIEHGGNETEAIAALLHDAAEDQGGEPRLRDIEERFGAEVASIVKECSDALVEDGPKPPWRERKEAYIAKVPSKSPSAQLVTAADKLHNARTILSDYRVHGESLWERFNGGTDVIWYYRSVADGLLTAMGPHPLACELERIVTEIEDRRNGQ